MAGDVLPGASFRQGNNFSVMVHCESAAEMEGLFRALGEDGEVAMTLQDTF